MALRAVRGAAALLCAASLTSGCAAIPVVVAMGAMGAIPGDATSDRAALALAEAEADAPPPAPAVAAEAENAPPGALPRLAALPPQTLAPGACALFLFSRGGPSADRAPQFVAMADAAGDTLLLGLEGGPRTLRADAAPDASSAGFAQTYEGGGEGGGLEVRLSARWGEVLPQGRRAPDASLRLAAPDGAARVTPLSGLLACEPEEQDRGLRPPRR